MREQPPTRHRIGVQWSEGSPSSWRSLFVGIADGRMRAFEELYDAVSGRLYGLALWHTGSPEDARDVVQEVFVKLAEQRDRLHRVRDPRAWLLTVAYRLSVDVLRRRRRRCVEPIDDHPLLVSSDADAGRALDAHRVSRLLASLPTAQRDAIYLRHFSDCTFSEIGAITGVPTFTAASRYRLGIRRLRRLVGGSP